MTKAAAIYQFWSGFGLTAYEENTVPEDAAFPYEPKVLLGRLTWRHKQYSCVGAQRPVVVLSRSIDTFERLLVQQDSESVIACHITHQ